MAAPKHLSKGKTRFGFAIPQMFPDGPVDLPLITGVLKQLEPLGFESAWTQDRFFFGSCPTLDPFTLMAYAAPFTNVGRLGVSVVVMPFHNPVNLAKTTTSLDQLTGGRLVLGIGIGRFTERYPAFGFTPAHRVTRFEESIRLLKRLWTQADVDYEGPFWNLDRVSIEPKPLQKPHPPLWFGARVDAALKRTVKMGDGWLAGGGYSTRAFKAAIKKIRRYLEEEEVDPSAFPLGKRVYIQVDRDRAAAARKLRDWFGRCPLEASMAEKVAIFGPEQECIDKLGEVIAEEPDLIVLNPAYDLPEQAERLAKDIVPRL